MVEIKVSQKHLEELRNLSDKQLELMGYDPQSITKAFLELEGKPDSRPKPKFFPSCS